MKAVPDIDKKLEEYNRGICIDIGCGQDKQKGFFGIDRAAFPGVDLVWDLEHFPYPLPDACASVIMGSHIIEHINPTSGDPRMANLIFLLKEKGVVSEKELQEYVGEYNFPSTIFMRFMDEMWRLLKPDGQLMLVFPYGGSMGYWQDPTHINGINEVTFSYFDPLDHNSQGMLYRTYHPKPWRIEYSTWAQSGNMEVCLRKRREDKSYAKL